MSGLQRSLQTFRRSGSSGLVWDDKFSSFSGDQIDKDRRGDEFRELRTSRTEVIIGSKIDCSMPSYNDRALAPSLPKISKRSVHGIYKKSMSAGAVESKFGSQ